MSEIEGQVEVENYIVKDRNNVLTWALSTAKLRPAVCWFLLGYGPAEPNLDLPARLA